MNIKVFFSKISSKFIYQVKEVWFVGFYQKIIEIYHKIKSRKSVNNIKRCYEHLTPVGHTQLAGCTTTASWKHLQFCVVSSTF